MLRDDTKDTQLNYLIGWRNSTPTWYFESVHPTPFPWVDWPLIRTSRTFLPPVFFDVPNFLKLTGRFENDYFQKVSLHIFGERDMKFQSSFLHFVKLIWWTTTFGSYDRQSWVNRFFNGKKLVVGIDSRVDSECFGLWVRFLRFFRSCYELSKLMLHKNRFLWKLTLSEFEKLQKI